MSEDQGEKTEQPTPRKEEEAIKRGQFPRSMEVQTVFVLFAGLMAFKFAGADIWNRLAGVQVSILGHLHDIPLSINLLQAYAVKGMLVFGACVGPIILGTMIGGLVAGTIQNRFQTASEALEPKWERLNPVEGFKRIFSMRSLAPSLFVILKFVFIALITYTGVKQVLEDPIFTQAIDLARISQFLADSAGTMIQRVGMGLAVIAGLDYSYQVWRTHQDLMMTKQELKDEMKNTEGNPLIKSQQRRRRMKTIRQMLKDVENADVVVANPTHIAIALRYDRKMMKAPKIIAKGADFNAEKIKEVARKFQVPIVENKPLARLLYKYGKVDGEIPAQFFKAVAEILAWVYRVNRYRYYAERNQS